MSERRSAGLPLYTKRVRAQSLPPLSDQSIGLRSTRLTNLTGVSEASGILSGIRIRYHNIDQRKTKAKHVDT